MNTKLKQSFKKTFSYKIYRKFMGYTFQNRVAARMIYIRFICWFPSKHLRLFLMNRFKNVHIDKSVPIYSGFEWWSGPFVIRENSTIGFHTHIDCRQGCYIGRNVCIATGVKIWTLHHDYNDVHFKCIGAPVYINDWAWIGSFCIILPGVTIGEGAVVAAGAVVTKNVAPWTVVGGIPATVIGHREQKQYDYNPANGWFHFL